MKKTIIFGCSAFAKQIKYALNEDGREVSAFCVNREYLTQDYFENKPVLPFEDISQYYSKDDFEILLAVGYTKMNKNREMIFNKCHENNYKIGTYIQSNCIVKHNNIGEGSIIINNSVIDPFGRIGKGNIISRTLVSHDCVLGDFNYLAASSLAGFVTINNNTFLGVNSTIGNNVTIDGNTIIGAGVTVTKDIPANSIVVPASNRIAQVKPELVGMFLK